ncbi:hypothetical protein [Campylobacter ureolyticus]|uniref:hypothetical protein n=1 Tax=Campylobacter ureolyticus TaxID=827 RepID=UPI00288C48E7|nr:hypothetical protein [Campylobacter ureolyticus]
MTIAQAYEKTKKLQKNTKNGVARLVYKNYKGYDAQVEPIDLVIVKNSLGMISQLNNDFLSNTKAKYGR